MREQQQRPVVTRERAGGVAREGGVEARMGAGDVAHPVERVGAVDRGRQVVGRLREHRVVAGQRGAKIAPHLERVGAQQPRLVEVRPDAERLVELVERLVEAFERAQRAAQVAAQLRGVGTVTHRLLEAAPRLLGLAHFLEQHAEIVACPGVGGLLAQQFAIVLGGGLHFAGLAQQRREVEAALEVRRVLRQGRAEAVQRVLGALLLAP